jgi:hypothetical protein
MQEYVNKLDHSYYYYTYKVQRELRESNKEWWLPIPGQDQSPLTTWKNDIIMQEK